MIIFVIFVFGLIFGSFANVCIYRMPREMSIVFPASHCTKCNSPILWYDNIPVLSYLLLKGKCRKCGKTSAHPCLPEKNGIIRYTFSITGNSNNESN